MFAAQQRRETGPVYALNGDELLDIDLSDLLARHVDKRPAATITVAPLRSHLGVVDLGPDDTIVGFREAPLLPFWVNTGLYVLDDEAIARLPERGDHETTTFPELAAEGRLRAWRHEGLWLTVNTPRTSTGSRRSSLNRTPSDSARRVWWNGARCRDTSSAAGGSAVISPTLLGG